MYHQVPRLATRGAKYNWTVPDPENKCVEITHFQIFPHKTPKPKEPVQNRRISPKEERVMRRRQGRYQNCTPTIVSAWGVGADPKHDEVEIVRIELAGLETRGKQSPKFWSGLALHVCVDEIISSF